MTRRTSAQPARRRSFIAASYRSFPPTGRRPAGFRASNDGRRPNGRPGIDLYGSANRSPHGERVSSSSRPRSHVNGFHQPKCGASRAVGAGRAGPSASVVLPPPTVLNVHAERSRQLFAINPSRHRGQMRCGDARHCCVSGQDTEAASRGARVSNSARLTSPMARCRLGRLDSDRDFLRRWAGLRSW